MGEESSTADEKMPPNEAEVAAATAASKMDPETEPLNAGGDPKVKFIGGAESVDVEKGGVKADKDEVKGALTKAELMKYATDKKWVTTRWALFIIFWICWLAMLVASVVIIIKAPKCPSPEPKQWWQKSPVYEVYVKSFKDSNGDGIGDLQGVESKLDYLKGLGVGSVYLSNIYKSPMQAGGDDVAYHKEVDPNFGTMEDFDNLLENIHANDMKVIMDFIPNLYEHQPNLDLRNEAVVNKLIDILQFWVDKGVDGFRIDSVAPYFDSEDPQNQGSVEAIDLLKKLRAVLNEASKDNPTEPRIIMISDDKMTPEKLAGYYGNIADQIGDVSHMPLNFNLILDFESPDSFSATALKASIERYNKNLPTNAWPNYCLGNLDSSRVASRLGSSRVKAMNMILMLLQGTPLTYYGEEIGMVDGNGNNAIRTPMQWSADAQAGFTDGSSSWLSVNEDYKDVNVLKAEETENSALKIYREMTNLREDEAILFGDTNIFVQEDTFVLSRVKKGNPGYLLVSNFGENPTTLDLQALPNIAERGIVTIGDQTSDLTVDSNVDLANISIPPNVSILVTFVPKFK